MTEESKHSYAITLLIVHPDMDPKRISKALDTEPDMSRMAGKEYCTPNGTSLGLSRDTRWSCSSRIIDGERFFEPVRMAAGNYYRHKEFFRKIVDEGGRVEIIVNVPGKKNQGDTLDFATLEKLSEMKINLGLEVFPDWNLEDTP